MLTPIRALACAAALAGLAAASAPARADEIYTFVVKKAEAKKASRWSLDEWLAARDRMRLMDLWLALHTPTPYEFLIGADYQLTERADDVKGNQARLVAAAYARIFGLGFEKGFSPYDDFLAYGLLRVFGVHAQGTHITLHGGVRQQTGPVDARNALAGATMAIYLTQFVGIEGLFRHHFASVPGDTGARTTGNRWEAGAFIDFSFVRVLGKVIWENEARDLQGARTDAGRSGFSLGTRIFF